jgi:hypothetical protein
VPSNDSIDNSFFSRQRVQLGIFIMSTPSNSDPDLIDFARRIAHAHCNTPSASCRLHDEQGCFSKTYIVTLEDQSNIIVQFRDTPLDLSLYEVARGTSFFARIYTRPLSFCREIGSPGSNYREEERRYCCFQARLHHELHRRINVEFCSWCLARRLGRRRCDRWPTWRCVIALYSWPRLLGGR